METAEVKDLRKLTKREVLGYLSSDMERTSKLIQACQAAREQPYAHETHLTTLRGAFMEAINSELTEPSN